MITVDQLQGLGPALKRLRADAGLRQADVREHSGLKAPQISRYENGHEVPSLESLVKYLGAVGCDLGDLQRALQGDSGAKAIPAPRKGEAIPASRESETVRQPAIGPAEPSPELRRVVAELMKPSIEALGRLEARVGVLEARVMAGSGRREPEPAGPRRSIATPFSPSAPKPSGSRW